MRKVSPFRPSPVQSQFEGRIADSSRWAFSPLLANGFAHNRIFILFAIYYNFLVIYRAAVFVLGTWWACAQIPPSIRPSAEFDPGWTPSTLFSLFPLLISCLFFLPFLFRFFVLKSILNLLAISLIFFLQIFI